MKLLLIGKNGQLGRELFRTLAPLGDLAAVDRKQVDLAYPDSIRSAVQDTAPDVIINAAAYTAVDRAETEQAAAFAVNRDGPAVLAEEAAKRRALLVHFSTDYVFDGEKPTPYVESDDPNPLNAYGHSKLAGEREIQDSGCRHVILRTSWIYSASGQNFLLTMLALASRVKEIRVVDDQFGAPTSSRMIADAVPTIVSKAMHDERLCDVYHMTAAGTTSWCQFARAILGGSAEVIPISSRDFAAPARRPRNSELDNSKLRVAYGIELPAWRAGLSDVLQQLRRERGRSSKQPFPAEE